MQVISLAYLSSTKDGLGSRVELGVRPEWADIEPVAYLTGLSKLPVGQFVTPIVNTVDPTSDLGAAMDKEILTLTYTPSTIWLEARVNPFRKR